MRNHAHRIDLIVHAFCSSAKIKLSCRTAPIPVPEFTKVISPWISTPQDLSQPVPDGQQLPPVHVPPSAEMPPPRAVTSCNAASHSQVRIVLVFDLQNWVLILANWVSFFLGFGYRCGNIEHVCIAYKAFGGVTQMVECRLSMTEVRRSMLRSSSFGRLCVEGDARRC